MRENLYEPERATQWIGTASQCFTCKNKECNRNIFKKNKVGGIDIAPGNPGVVLLPAYCKNRKE